MEVVIQAFQIAEDLKVEKAYFESDSHGVVMAINGMKEYEDWQAKANINLDLIPYDILCEDEGNYVPLPVGAELND